MNQNDQFPLVSLVEFTVKTTWTKAFCYAVPPPPTQMITGAEGWECMAGSGETYPSCKTCSLKRGGVSSHAYGGHHNLEARWSPGGGLFSRTCSRLQPATPIPCSQMSFPSQHFKIHLKCHVYWEELLTIAPTQIESSPPVSQGPTHTLDRGIHNASLHSFLFMPIFLTSLSASWGLRPQHLSQCPA